MTEKKGPPGVNVSVFIQTLDEEKNLEACLAAFAWCDDVVVLDSFSSDRTEAIAKAHGARWIQHEYKGRAAHQNWAMENISFKYPWVYYSDADERVPKELVDEILCVTSDPTATHVAYQVRRRDHFQGKWIKRSTCYPLWFVRLFRPEKIRWDRKANPVPNIDGTVGRLENDYLHYPFSKGISDWIWRHNRYSSYEAEETIKSLRDKDLVISDLWSGDDVSRRKALKTLSFRLPFRPLLKFLYLYFFRRGFIDGIPGLQYCVLQSIYEFFIVLKINEIKNRRA